MSQFLAMRDLCVGFVLHATAMITRVRLTVKGFRSDTAVQDSHEQELRPFLHRSRAEKNPQRRPTTKHVSQMSCNDSRGGFSDSFCLLIFRSVALTWSLGRTNLWKYSCEEPLKVHFENMFVLCLVLLAERC